MLQATNRIRAICALLKQNLKSKPLNGIKCAPFLVQQIRGKKDDSGSISSLFIPVPVKPNPDDINVGAELTGTLNKADLLKVLTKFYQKKEIKQLLTENGLDSTPNLNAPIRSVILNLILIYRLFTTSNLCEFPKILFRSENVTCRSACCYK